MKMLFCYLGVLNPVPEVSQLIQNHKIITTDGTESSVTAAFSLFPPLRRDLFLLPRQTLPAAAHFASWKVQLATS